MKKRLVLFFSLTGLILFIFAGCGASGPSPTETTDAFLKGIQSGDDSAVNSVYAPGDFQMSSVLDVDGTEEIDQDELIAKTLLTKMQEFEYELSNEQINEDKATVDVKITTYPFGTAVTEAMTDYIGQAFALAFSDPSDEQLEKLFETVFTPKIEALSEKSYSQTVTIGLTSIDGVWKVDGIEEDSDFINALSGNLIKSMENLEEVYSSFDNETDE